MLKREDDPLIFCLRLAIDDKTSTGRYIEGLLTAACDCFSDGLQSLTLCLAPFLRKLAYLSDLTHLTLSFEQNHGYLAYQI